MALLVGTHVNKIDKKGRVSVPKPFRDFFTGRDFTGVYVLPHLKIPAIVACDEARMQRMHAGLEGLGMFSDDQDDLAYIVMERAHFLPFDPEGRIVLPAAQLEYAGIGGQALFAGRAWYFVIWRPEAHAEHAAGIVARARERGMVLPLGPGPDGDAT